MAAEDPAVLARTVSPFDLAERALAAEEKVAAARSALLEGAQDPAMARRRALAILASKDQGRGYDRDFCGPSI